MIETKKIDRFEDADALMAFGWQLTQEITEHHGRSNRIYKIMARDTSMPHYLEYKQYENEYYSAKYKMKTYKPMEFSTVLLLLLIFVIPDVLYIMYKLNQKAEIKENNDNCRLKMIHAVQEARNIK